MTEWVTIGNCRLARGDCHDILPEIDKVDALVTDPPYEIETSGGGIFRSNRGCMDRIAEMGIDKGFDHSFLTPAIADSVVCFCHNDQLAKLLPWFAEQFEKYALCSWHKENPMPVANKHYKPDTEFYIHAWNKVGHPVGDLCQKARYVFAPVGKSEWQHPTVKPDKVMDKIMANVNGETVLDCFMGTGSTGIAAIKAGKKFVGIEREPKFFDIACKRIKQFYDQGRLL